MFGTSIGNFRRTCGGRCLMLRVKGKDNMICWTLGLLVLPTTLWFVSITSFLKFEFGTALALATTGLVGISFVSALYYLVATMVTEPGLLFTYAPKVTPNISGNITENGQKEGDGEGENMADYAEEGDAEGSYHPKDELVYRKFTHVVLHLQNTPHLLEMTALRAKMCRQADCCIWEFDHFCPWVGNAIGRRNYRSFVAFLTAVCILDMTILASTAVRIMAFVASFSSTTTTTTTTTSTSSSASSSSKALL